MRNNLSTIELFFQEIRGGLGVLTAAIFLAGEMAGSGVLALPFALVGTGRIRTPCVNRPLRCPVSTSIFPFCTMSAIAL